LVEDDGDSALGTAVAESSPCVVVVDTADGSVAVSPAATAVLDTGEDDRLDELDSMEEANDTESSLSL
jgi:hypothetical protein